MAATLTIDRSALSLADLVIGSDEADGFTLDPDLSMGSITWRKQTNEQPNVPGRTFNGTFTRDTMTASGSITCYGTNAEDLQDHLEQVIAALTSIVGGVFVPYTMTYTHDPLGTPATYSWKCTEPADCIPGQKQDGTLDDMEMASNILSIAWSVTRNPIPLAGPI